MPKTPQAVAKTRQEAPKTPQDAPKARQDASGGRQEARQEHQSTIGLNLRMQREVRLLVLLATGDMAARKDLLWIYRSLAT